MAALQIKGSSFYIAGRFERVPKSRIEREVASRGGTLHRRPTQRTDYIVVTHEAAGRLTSPSFKSLLARASSRYLSEEAILRALSLAPALQGKDIDERRFESLSGLGPVDIRLLTLFDIIAPHEAKYGFGDLKIAQHVATLKRNDISIESIIAAAAVLRRQRRGSDPQDVIRLDVAPGGELMMRIGEVLCSKRPSKPPRPATCSRRNGITMRV